MLVPFLAFAEWLQEQEGKVQSTGATLGEAEIDVTEHSMREAMNEEVRLTLDIHERHHVWSDIGKDYSWWKNLSKEVRVIPENMPKTNSKF